MENLDSMTRDELGRLYARYVQDPEIFKQELFPDREAVPAKVLKSVALYIMNKLAAMRLRSAGDNEALRYEGVCDKVYKQLPSYARW